jgi:hypothetical protein
MFTDKAEIIRILRNSKKPLSTPQIRLEIRRVPTVSAGSVRVFLSELCRGKIIDVDKTVRPAVYSIRRSGKSLQNFFGPITHVSETDDRPVRTQSQNFPDYMIAVRRKGKEFRHPFKDEKSLGEFLDKLSIEDEVAIYKKAECKKEVKAIWKLS